MCHVEYTELSNENVMKLTIKRTHKKTHIVPFSQFYLPVTGNSIKELGAKNSQGEGKKGEGLQRIGYTGNLVRTLLLVLPRQNEQQDL